MDFITVACCPFVTVEVLMSFYQNRLKDHYVVIPPVLQGLRALVRLYLLDLRDQGHPQKNSETVSVIVN